jgi:hypothetical protein
MEGRSSQLKNVIGRKGKEGNDSCGMSQPAIGKKLSGGEFDIQEQIKPLEGKFDNKG